MLNPIYIAVSYVLRFWHSVFAHLFGAASGASWALAIVFLVVTIRALLFRFFIKQVHNQRKMQEIQPKIAALREKHKGDRNTLNQEMLKLQREEGFNPIGGCLPILLQAPIFLSLFHVLRTAADPRGGGALIAYKWTWNDVGTIGRAKVFGAPIAAAFRTPVKRIEELGGTLTATRVVTMTLIVLMCLATYVTQKQIMSRSGQVLDGQQAMIQKLMLYGMPISLFVSGFLFPLGVILYWFSNNVFTMGQQFYILHRMPPPGAKPNDDGKPAIDPKLYAPKPGAKPVNPRTRRPALPAGTAALTGSLPDVPDDVVSTPDSPTDAQPPATNGKTVAADGKTPRPGVQPTTKAANPKARRTGPANGAAPAGSAGTPMKPGTPAAPTAPAPDGASPPPAAPPPASGAGSGPPRPARRPPGQRSSTTTRPKKKRR